MNRGRGRGRGSHGGPSASSSPPFGIHRPTRPPTSPSPRFLYERLYKTADGKEILDYIFDPALWLLWFNADRDYALKKVMRKMIQISTIDAFLGGRYVLPSGEVVRFDPDLVKACARATVSFPEDFPYNPPGAAAAPPMPNTSFFVVEGDCLEVAILTKNITGLNPAVLNMASAYNPGGGYKNGAGAQEENLHRRTCLMWCLEDPYRVDADRRWSYPIPEFGGLYSPDVLVIRGSEAAGYPFLDSPQTVSIVSCAAYKDPPMEKNARDEWVISGRVAERTRLKFRALLNICMHNRHQAVVLSALGCGAYGNPPAHIARLFAEELASPRFRNQFRFVAFAIIDDHNARKAHNPTGNVRPFAEAFRVPLLNLESFVQAISAQVAPQPVVASS